MICLEGFRICICDDGYQLDSSRIMCEPKEEIITSQSCDDVGDCSLIPNSQCMDSLGMCDMLRSVSGGCLSLV